MSLLGLPPELRSNIYEHFLQDLVFPKWHPWDDLPSHERWLNYVSLLLTSRQVNDECQKIFRKHYSHLVTYYFERPEDLLGSMRHNPNCMGRRFLLRALNWSNRMDSAFKWRGEALEFIAAVPSINEDWLSMPGFFYTNPAPIMMPFKRANRSHGLDFGSTWSPDHLVGLWVPEQHGFHRFTGDHTRCPEDLRVHCKPYVVLEWPLLPNGCKITCYTWTYPRHETHGMVWPASMMLEGRFHDLDVTDLGSLTWRGQDL